VKDLRQAIRLLPDGRLVTFPGAGHGLGKALPAALERAAGFIATLSA
jgi:hypothetical protein